MKMNPPLYQVTEWAMPDSTVDTLDYGEVSLMFWLSMEANRWARKGDTAIIKIEHGQAALFGYGVELPTDQDINERQLR